MRKSRLLRFETFINGLTVDDFKIEAKTLIGSVAVVKNDHTILHPLVKGEEQILTENNGRVRRVRLPKNGLSSLQLGGAVFLPNIDIVIDVSEACYKEYLDKIKDVHIANVNTYILTAEIIECDELRFLERYFKFRTLFMTGRYNLLNLVTDSKTYSVDEYAEFVAKIKGYIFDTAFEKSLYYKILMICD